jgi:dynein light chain roadblock-type
LIVVNSEGIPIKTTLDNSTTVQYAGLLHQLTSKARSVVRDIDPQNDLTFLRIRSKKHEIMVAPGLLQIFIEFKKILFLIYFIFLIFHLKIDKEYLLIVIQNSDSNHPVLN